MNGLMWRLPARRSSLPSRTRTCHGAQFGQSYSRLRQINAANLQNLKVAWTFRTDDPRKFLQFRQLRSLVTQVRRPTLRMPCAERAAQSTQLVPKEQP